MCAGLRGLVFLGRSTLAAVPEDSPTASCVPPVVTFPGCLLSAAAVDFAGYLSVWLLEKLQY